MNRELAFMQEAIQLARNGMRKGDGGPFGCIVVRGDEIVARGWNKVIVTNDPTAHAEVVAIREACTALGSFQLTDCEIYTSCEPCPMCMGAIYWARPKKVYYANNREDAARAGFDDSFIYSELNLPANNRRIIAECIGREQALPVFEEWINQQNKTIY